MARLRKKGTATTFISKWTRMFAQIYDHRVAVDVYPDTAAVPGSPPQIYEDGVEVLLRITTVGGGRFRFNLTRMTRPELELFADMVNAAVDLARPVTTARDETAQEMDDNGEEDNEHTLRRLYAGVPVLLAKEGRVSADVPELPVRPDDDAKVAGYTVRRTRYEPPARDDEEPSGPLVGMA